MRKKRHARTPDARRGARADADPGASANLLEGVGGSKIQCETQKKNATNRPSASASLMAFPESVVPSALMGLTLPSAACPCRSSSRGHLVPPVPWKSRSAGQTHPQTELHPECPRRETTAWLWLDKRCGKRTRDSCETKKLRRESKVTIKQHSNA